MKVTFTLIETNLHVIHVTGTCICRVIPTCSIMLIIIIFLRPPVTVVHFMSLLSSVFNVWMGAQDKVSFLTALRLVLSNLKM